MISVIEGVLMLVRLLPDDIERGWDVISTALNGSMPSHIRADDIGMTYVLHALLDETLQCWLISDDDYKDKGICGIITTTITVDKPSNTKNLFIYSLFAYRPFTQEVISNGFNTLKTFARAMKCYKVTAYTNIPQIESMVLKLGGRVVHTLVELEV